MTCLDDEGMAEIAALIDYYLENAKILKEVQSESIVCVFVRVRVRFPAFMVMLVCYA